MSKDCIPVLLAVGCATAFLLLAAGCGTPAALDQGPAGTSDTPTLTSLPSATEGATEPAADEAAGAGEKVAEVEAPSPPEASPGPTLAPETVTPAPGQEGEEAVAIPDPLRGSKVTPQTRTERLVAIAVADLARRLGVDEAEITVQSVEAVEWPDSSLGCPQPGVSYLQVVTPGYLMVLGVKGKAYEVHTDAKDSVVLCDEEPVAVVAATSGTIEPGLEALAARAKEDLARLLNVEAGQIEILEARSVVWGDASLGCPKPGMGYSQVLQEGALIRLSVGPFQYEYHSGGSQSPFLCEPFSPGSKTPEPPGYEPLPLDPPND